MKYIFCDESGFTSNNLLDSSQPFFVYAGVEAEPDRAKRFVSQAITKLPGERRELKGAKLAKQSAGKDTVTRVFDAFAEDVSLVIYRKDLALCGKFYEYIFDPVIGRRSQYFYDIGVHRFVMNYLYMHYRGGGVARALLQDFQKLLADKDPSSATCMFNQQSAQQADSPFIEDMIQFCCLYEEQIVKEVRRLKSDEVVGRAVLDLTTTALHDIVHAYNEKHRTSEFVCDNSKPIANAKAFIDIMLESHPELNADPLILADSKERLGIQIADVFASGLCYALRNPEEHASKTWSNRVQSSVANIILPDPRYLDENHGEAEASAKAIKKILEMGERRGFT